MRRALSRFADLLRREGVRVSSAELIDAAAAVELVDLSDRAALRDVLKTTLAKSRDESERVESAFDRFFVPPPMGRRTKRRRRKRGAEPGGDPGSDREARSGSSGEPGGSPSSAPSPSPLLRKAAQRIVEHRRQTLEALRRPRPSLQRERYPCPILRAQQPAPMARRENGERKRNAAGSRRADVPGRARGERDDLRDRPRSPAGGQPVPDLARKPFRDRWSAEEADELSHLVHRVIAHLRLRRTRRRRAARHGALWLTKIMRRNVGHEGVPFHLVRHRPRRREPHLLLLVDVSHSVARAAAAFLALATNLTRSFRGVTVYAFVDRAVEISTALPALAHLEGRVTLLDRVVEAFPDINPYALSDYGRVLHQVLERERWRLRRDTVCLVLGDARTNRFDPAAWTLEELGERMRRVIWLVPEPMAEWDTGDSVVEAYAPHLDLLAEAADLVGLRIALDRALRA